MYGYQNAEGEPMMSGVDYMREGAYADEYDVDDFYNAGGGWEPDPTDPSECQHHDGSLPEGAGFDCDHCGELYHGPRFDPEPNTGEAWRFWTYGD